MTDTERQAIIFSAFAAIRRMVPNQRRKELEQHLRAATAAFNDQSVTQFDRGVQKGAEAAMADAYQRGRADGMISVECRLDRRDLEDVQDPAELRSAH